MRHPTYPLASLKAERRGDNQQLGIVICIQGTPLPNLAPASLG